MSYKKKRVNPFPHVYVNTTDATAGATALLLPAQNTHTLHDPKRDTEHARAGGVEDGLSVGGLDGGGDVGDVVCEEAAGDARPSPYRVLSVAPGRRVWRAREEAKDGADNWVRMVMTVCVPCV